MSLINRPGPGFLRIGHRGRGELAGEGAVKITPAGCGSEERSGGACLRYQGGGGFAHYAREESSRASSAPFESHRSVDHTSFYGSEVGF